jgi:predicted nucleic acid-binding protein
VIVTDASAILEVLLRTPASRVVEKRIFRSRETLHAPHLLDVEVAQTLRRYAAMGDLDDDRGREALMDLSDFPIERYPHDLLLPRVWELRCNVTTYDAVYLALAELLDAPLVTRDRRMAAAPGHDAVVELL